MGLRGGSSQRKQAPGTAPVFLLPGTGPLWKRVGSWIKELWWGFVPEDRRPGRQDVWRAKDRGELVPPEISVTAIGTDTLVVRARPKASMKFRVYRAETGQWSEYMDAEAVVMRSEPEGGK